MIRYKDRVIRAKDSDLIKEMVGGADSGFIGWYIKGSPVMGIKEHAYGTEHWVLYANNKSWSATLKTNDVLYSD